MVCAPPTSTELSPFSSPFLWPPWPGPERRTATPFKKGSSASERDGAVLGLGDGVGGGSPEHTGHRSVEGGCLLAGGCRWGRVQLRRRPVLRFLARNRCPADIGAGSWWGRRGSSRRTHASAVPIIGFAWVERPWPWVSLGRFRLQSKAFSVRGRGSLWSGQSDGVMTTWTHVLGDAHGKPPSSVPKQRARLKKSWAWWRRPSKARASRLNRARREAECKDVTGGTRFAFELMRRMPATSSPR